MKKMFFTLGCITAILFFQSCEKVKDAVLDKIDPFTISLSENEFEIPMVEEAVAFTTPPVEEVVDINQLVKKNAGVNMKIQDFSYVRLLDAKLKLDRQSETTNWTNLEYTSIEVNTDRGLQEGKPWLKAEAYIADEEAEKFSDKTLAFPETNMLDYLYDTETVLMYRFTVKMRRGMTEGLPVKSKIRLEFKP